jgi:PAS domain S-box-containing protein
MVKRAVDPGVAARSGHQRKGQANAFKIPISHHVNTVIPNGSVQASAMHYDLGPEDFRALADNIPALCWIARGDGAVIWYNRQWYEYTGATPEAMRGWGWQSVHDPETLPGVLERWRASIATGDAFEMVFPLRGADGGYRPFLTRAIPVKDEAGHVTRWFGKCSDISKLQETEAALRDSDARYRSAMTLGRMAAWETDYVARRRKWTAEGMQIFGIELADGIGQVGGDHDEFRLALHPEDRHLAQSFHDIADRQDSFPAEYRIVRPDGVTRWMSGHGLVVDRAPDGKARRLMNAATDVTDRKAMEDHAKFLMRELLHRSKNILSVVQSIASRTARGAGNLKEFERAFGDRLRALSASNDVLADNSWNGARLDELVRSQLAPFVETPSERIAIEGPPLSVTADATQSIGLALHELTTNAIKYGALSSPGGKVEIRWAIERQEGAPSLRLEWMETGGPPVARPGKKGFGHVVIQQMIEQSLSGAVKIDYTPAGMTWSLTAPLSVVSDPIAGEARRD